MFLKIVEKLLGDHRRIRTGKFNATPFLGPTVEKEIESTSQYSRTHNGACLFCDLLTEELKREEADCSE